MPAVKPNLFNIPASVPFLPALIKALHDGRLVKGFPAGGDPLALARATLYLPTRRACRLARDVFLDTLGADAAILPRIVALGDLDEDEIAFADAATAELAEDALALPEAIQPLERRLLLAQLIVEWSKRILADRKAMLEDLHRTGSRRTADRQYTGNRAWSGRRSRPSDRRHDHA